MISHCGVTKFSLSFLDFCDCRLYMIRKQFRRNAGQLKSSNLDFMLLWNFAQTYLFWDTTDWSSFGELTILYICHWLWLEVEFELQWTSWRCVVHDTSYSLDYSGHLLYHFLTYSLWSASVINGCIHLIFQLFLYLYNMLVMESLYFAQNSRIFFWCLCYVYQEWLKEYITNIF